MKNYGRFLLPTLFVALASACAGGGGGGSTAPGSGGGQGGDCSPSASGAWMVTATIVEGGFPGCTIWPSSVNGTMEFLGSSVSTSPPISLCAYSFVGAGLDTTSPSGGKSSLGAVREEGLPAPFGFAGVWYEPASGLSVSVGLSSFLDPSSFGADAFSVEQDFDAYWGNVITSELAPDGTSSDAINPDAVLACSGRVRFDGIRISSGSRLAAHGTAPRSAMGAWDVVQEESPLALPARFDARSGILRLAIPAVSQEPASRDRVLLSMLVQPDGRFRASSPAGNGPVEIKIQGRFETEVHATGRILLGDATHGIQITGPFEITFD